MPVASSNNRTLIFCTAYTPSGGDRYYNWNIRYKIWIEALMRSKLVFDQLLLIDDGSELMPDWPDITIILEGDELRTNSKLVLYHFNTHLGRKSLSDFPGWVRSFFFASRYAEENGFNKIVHIEADAFLISDRAQSYINEAPLGWISFWCPLYDRPESGIQVISGSAALALYKEWGTKSIGDLEGKIIEQTLPFSFTQKSLIGDRYREIDNMYIPKNADWCMQARPEDNDYENYFWWMPWLKTSVPEIVGKNMVKTSKFSEKQQHSTFYYLEWLKNAVRYLACSQYIEIGTHAGESLRVVPCNAVCIDPKFSIDKNAIFSRKLTVFFQGTSDEFFDDRRMVSSFVPDGVDFAFLDGLHLFEALLNDFMNVEMYSKRDTVIVIHDCFPLNTRMAERMRRDGDESEPEMHRQFWTGDVWKVAFILKRYRPDLSIFVVDAAPTGLLVCCNLDFKSTTLSEVKEKVVKEYVDLELTDDMLSKLWKLFRVYDAASTVENAESLKSLINPVLFAV